MRKIVLILVLGFISLMVCSCKGTRVITVDAPRIEKEYVVSTDTIHQYDSIYVFNDRYIDRDTVYITKVNEKYKYLYRTKVDTLLRCDTITVVNTEQIKALSSENDGLKATMYFYRYLGFCMIGIIFLMGLYIFFKK